MENRQEVGLRERCKLVVWMDQLQSPEIVQLRFKKEFQKEPPNQEWIKDIYLTFMKTGSVFYYYESLLKNLRNEDKTASEVLIKIDGVKSENDESREVIELYAAEEEDEVFCNLISIVKNEDLLKDEEECHTEIFVNEGTTESSFESDAFFCSSCGYETMDENLFMTHQKAHSRKDYFKCKNCLFTSNSTILFRSHQKNCKGKKKHSKERDEDQRQDEDEETENVCYTCEQCGKAYSSLSSLKMHQAYHSKLRPYACDKCDYRFCSEKTLKKHELTHDKIKHLECPHCSFKCSLSGNMIIHARTHTGEKPYKCPDCSYKTGNPSTIKRHIANHKNELKYRCRKCNYKTSKSSLLANHVKSHSSLSEFKCHICQEQLRNAYSLRYHMTKQHSEQKILECPFCDFCQKDKSLLKIHIRRHTGEKPYICSEEDCDFRAIRSQDLKKHMGKIHCIK